MSTLHTNADILLGIARNMDQAGHRNAADQIAVIARDLVRWGDLLNKIYAETIAEIAEVENRLGGRRLAIMTGDVANLRGGGK